MVEGGEEKETAAAAAALNHPVQVTESVSREERKLGFRAAIISLKFSNTKPTRHRHLQ